MLLQIIYIKEYLSMINIQPIRWVLENSMTVLGNVSKHIIKEILIQKFENGILNVLKEYGMFIAS